MLKKTEYHNILNKEESDAHITLKHIETIMSTVTSNHEEFIGRDWTRFLFEPTVVKYLTE